MLQTYRDGEFLEVVGGVVKGGVTVMLRDRQDFAFLRSICAMSALSSEPLHVIYGLLHSDADILPIPFLNRYSLSEENRSSDNEAQALDAAMSVASEIWDQQEDRCVMTVSVARPGNYAPKLDLSHDRSALVLHKGSVRATLSLGTLRVAGFAVGMFCARGIAPSQRAERILEDTRRKALNRPNVEPLDRLDEQRPGAYRGHSAVILFLHGLLSTDVGLFDPLIRRFQHDPEFSDCAFVGWPHDTLAGIDGNSSRLRALIDQVIGVDGPPVIFVAHSRGGLLARSTSVKLYDKNKIWTMKLSGCITFGTPHEGCPLAEAPGDLLGKIICLQALRNTGSWLSLTDALTYANQTREFRGIEQLRPISGGGDFLKELLDAEARYAPDGMERALDILAVGGRARRESLFNVLSDRALATSEHDLIVETRSSIPRLFVQREATDCDHFGYFSESQMLEGHIDSVVFYCRNRLNLDDLTRSASGTTHQTRRIPENWSESDI